MTDFRRKVRTVYRKYKIVRHLWVLVLATAVGAMAGGTVTAMSRGTHEIQLLLFTFPQNTRLSEQVVLTRPWAFLVPALGGIVIGAMTFAIRRYRLRQPVDPIEANALHGGRMSMRESLLVTVQTMISSGFGASVGLEAGYTQAGSGLASKLAVLLSLRRNEVRMLVGCGAAGAISAAFGTPITGAFYGFELIVGTYSIALAAPVMAAALMAEATASWLGAVPMPIEVGAVPTLSGHQLIPFLALGILGGLAAVVIMRLVSVVENGFRALRCPPPLRPLLGGLAVGGLAMISPQVLSSGHGALHLELNSNLAWTAILALFCLKTAASALSLGSGFRGGLFYASLFLGSLLGNLFTVAMHASGILLGVQSNIGAVIGMASVAAGIVGGPMTMTFLVLETTHDLTIGGAVLATSIMSSIVVRETFGYSFSTWRLHLRGETIRSAHDVGWMRSLDVGAMMRIDVKTFPADHPVAAFRAAFPLGSTQRVIAVDAEGRYAGMVIVADAYAAPPEGVTDPATPISALTRHMDYMLTPSLNVRDAARLFEAARSEELAVVDDPVERHVVGLVTEQYLLRRYAQELDKARRAVMGED